MIFNSIIEINRNKKISSILFLNKRVDSVLLAATVVKEQTYFKFLIETKRIDPSYESSRKKRTYHLVYSTYHR